MSSVFIFKLYLPAAALLFVFTLAIVAKFHSYKNKRNDIIDVIMLLATISEYISSTMYYAGVFMYPKWLSGITFCHISLTLSWLPGISNSGLYFAWHYKQCFNKCKVHKLMRKINGVNGKNVEKRSLLNHGSADDNA